MIKMVEEIDKILEKNSIIRNLILDMKMPKISYIDRAKLIKRALNIASIGKKKSDGQGTIATRVAKEIGLSGHKELYRCMAILNINDNTRKLIEQGKITPEKVARVVYNLKDKKKEDELIAKVINEEVPTLKAERMVSIVNNPKLVLNHILRLCENFMKDMKGYNGKCTDLDSKEKVILSSELTKVKQFTDEFRDKNLL